MAFTTSVYHQNSESLTIQDYTGSPISNTPYLIVGSFTGIPVDNHMSTEIFRASDAGQVRHGSPVGGVEGAKTISFQIWRADIDNDTDKNAESLLRGLAANSVAGTGHSGEVYTNQLTGGGKLMCKLVRVLTDEGGTTATETYPVRIDNVTEVVVNDARALQVDATLLGAITRA